ncbi:RDD family protein [Streptomyces galilaeus]
MSAPTPAPGDDRPREGYYPDPSIPGYVRYWNGAAWVPGTSRPAPSDGLSPGAGPSVEETGPHFFDEDPAPAHPEPASAWGADRAHQSGFGGAQDRHVSWGAPDPRVPADTPDEGTTTFRRPTPRTPQQGGAPGAQGGGTGNAGGASAEGSGGFGPAGSGAGAFGAQGSAAGGDDSARGSAAGGYGPQGSPGAGPGAGGFGAQGPQGSGSGAGGFGPQGSGGSAAGGYGPAGTGSAAGGLGGAGAAPATDGRRPGGNPPAAAGQGPGGNSPADDPSGPGFGAGKAAAARAAAAQAQAGQAGVGTGMPAAQAQAQAGRAGAGTGAAAPASASTALSSPPQPAPGVPQQSGPVQPQAGAGGTPMASGAGGGQPSWAQQVHRLAGDEDGPVAPWKPPVEDVFQAAARRQSAARPAGLGKRLVARLVDTLVLGAVTAVAAVPLGTKAADHINEKIDAAKLSGRAETVWLLDGTTAAYLGIVLAVLLLFGVLYEALPTARWGRTLGKKLCGLEVRGIESHEPPGFGGALRRWLVYSVPGLLGIGIIGVAWCLFDRPWHQCWHDKAAHTFVAG